MNGSVWRRWTMVTGAAALVLGAQLAVQAVGQLSAAAAVTGGTVRSDQTAFNSETPKTAVAHCPEGKRLVGGGGRVAGIPGHVVLTRLQPVRTNGLDRFEVVAAEDETGTTAQWAVTAVAICADPLPGLAIVSASAADQPGSDGQVVSRSCPALTQPVGSGGRITGGQGQVHLRAMGPTTRTQFPPPPMHARAQEDPTGFAGPWSVTAFAICASIPTADASRNANVSESNSVSPKVVPVECPAGMRVTGAAGAVNSSNPDIVIQSVLPEARPGQVPGTRATVIVRENNPTNENWSATAWAHCAR